MRTMLSKWLIMAILTIGFVSCGDDDDPKYDKINIIGNYTGTCQLLVGKTNKTENNFPVTFANDGNNTSILRAGIGNEEMYNSVGLAISNIMASGFVDKGNYARFSMENIKQAFSSENIPEFIKDQVQFEVNSAEMNLNCDPVQFEKSAKRLTFTYKGTISIKGKDPIETSTYNITYNIDVVK